MALTVLRGGSAPHPLRAAPSSAASVDSVHSCSCVMQGPPGVSSHAGWARAHVCRSCGSGSCLHWALLAEGGLSWSLRRVVFALPQASVALFPRQGRGPAGSSRSGLWRPRLGAGTLSLPPCSVGQSGAQAGHGQTTGFGLCVWVGRAAGLVQDVDAEAADWGHPRPSRSPFLAPQNPNPVLLSPAGPPHPEVVTSPASSTSLMCVPLHLECP